MLGPVARFACASNGAAAAPMRTARASGVFTAGSSPQLSNHDTNRAGVAVILSHCQRCYTTTAPTPKSARILQGKLQLAPPTSSGFTLKHNAAAVGSIPTGGSSSSVGRTKPKMKLEWRQYSSMSSGSAGQKQHIPVIRSVNQLRRWRRQARDEGLEVGVVPTMGALHQGHLDLVKASLQRHPLTVMTLFVNPMQFAPTEDLAAYPRTLERDLDLLRSLLPPNPSSSFRGLGISESDGGRPDHTSRGTASGTKAVSGPNHGGDAVRGLGVSENERPVSSPGSSLSGDSSILGSLVVFAPTPDVMYPLKGDLQDLKQKRGVEVDVKGWGDVMEGASRPQFFKGVATVCTKLFNAVEPDHAYFGQKDIQQALLLKIMLQDLLLAHPLPENMHILPTTRAPDGLALSSRNAYLSPGERAVSPTLYRALDAARQSYRSHTASASSPAATPGSAALPLTGEDLVSTATKIMQSEAQRLLDSAPLLPGQKNAATGASTAVSGSDIPEIRLDYVEVFDKHTFEPIRGEIEKGREMVIAGAMWVGKTRLIDNLLLGWGEGWEV